MAIVTTACQHTKKVAMGLYIFNKSDQSANSMSAIMNRCRLHDDPEQDRRSKCISCKYEHLDKNICLNTTECQLSPGRRKLTNEDLHPPGYDEFKTCPMEGCDVLMRAASMACRHHNALIRNRRHVGVPPGIIYKKDIRAWRQKYDPYDWQAQQTIIPKGRDK